MIPTKLEDGGPNVGQAQRRVDGRKKVTGEARYAGEHPADDLLHGVLVSARIARGKITTIDPAAALTVPGVLQVFTHDNRPKMPWFDRSYRDDDAPAGSPFRPLYDDAVVFAGQPIALVVATSFEAARHAARLVRATYDEAAFETDLAAAAPAARDPKKWGGGRKPPPKPRGHADKALASAPVKVDVHYEAPAEYHNAMEPFAATVVCESDGTFTVFDKTQSVLNTQAYLCHVFDLSEEQVHVRSPFVGGAFGSGLRPQHSVFFAFMAAKTLGRSVRVTLTRQQMFGLGYRPPTLQHVALGAETSGTLTAIVHEATSQVSNHEDYVETVVNWGSLLYTCDNVRTSHQVAPVDMATPIDMRAPGATTGMFAFESAMDELAHALGQDPLSLRLTNYAERAQDEDLDFSSKALRECYAEGAARFGWERRTHAPRSMRDGDKLVGWGMATGVWDAMQMMARARARLTIDGKLTVGSATADIGTGTYTIMSQIAADALGVPMERVTFELGDSRLPWAPLEGGSWTAVTVGSAVKDACDAVAKKVLDLAKAMPGSPFGRGVDLAAVRFSDGHVVLRADPTVKVAIADAMRAGDVLAVEETTSTAPYPGRARLAHNTHSAVFVEVAIDEALGMIEVRRVVSAIAAGRILNPRTARSQILGAVVWGISMALHEEALVDHTLGRVMNHSLAEYHVAVNKDVGEVEVIFVDEKDEHVNALGAKGVGEIGIVGVAAAIANAVFHATGRRIRDLPLTLDKVLGI